MGLTAEYSSSSISPSVVKVDDEREIVRGQRNDYTTPPD
jgi:hypothetical protein